MWNSKKQKPPTNLYFDVTKLIGASLKNENDDWFITVIIDDEDKTTLEFALENKEEGEAVIEWLYKNK